jgi:hypothetical protein
MESSLQNTQPEEAMDEEEKYQHIFFYFIRALRTLAMDAEPQCDSQGNFNVAQELQHEVLCGRYVIGKGKLNEAEETAIAAVTSAIGTVPDSALKFAEGHASNVKNMRHPAWIPVRTAAATLLKLLDSRIAENNAYFKM